MRKLLFLLTLSLPLAHAPLAHAQQPPADPDAKLRQQWEQRFRAADQDSSRSLDRKEAQAGLPKVLFRHFDEIDTDHDQHITPEELWAMHEREVAERDKRRVARTGPPR